MNIRKIVTETIIDMLMSYVLGTVYSVEEYAGESRKIEIEGREYVISLTRENVWALKKNGKLVAASQLATSHRYEAIDVFSRFIENDL